MIPPRCVWLKTINYFELKVAPDDLQLVLDVFADRLSFYSGGGSNTFWPNHRWPGIYSYCCSLVRSVGDDFGRGFLLLKWRVVSTSSDEHVSIIIINDGFKRAAVYISLYCRWWWWWCSFVGVSGLVWPHQRPAIWSSPAPASPTERDSALTKRQAHTVYGKSHGIGWMAIPVPRVLSRLVYYGWERPVQYHQVASNVVNAVTPELNSKVPCCYTAVQEKFQKKIISMSIFILFDIRLGDSTAVSTIDNRTSAMFLSEATYDTWYWCRHDNMMWRCTPSGSGLGNSQYLWEWTEGWSRRSSVILFFWERAPIFCCPWVVDEFGCSLTNFFLFVAAGVIIRCLHAVRCAFVSLCFVVVLSVLGAKGLRVLCAKLSWGKLKDTERLCRVSML